MSSTSTFNVLNHHFKPLCSSSLVLKALCDLALSHSRTAHFLSPSRPRFFSSLHSGSFMEVVNEVAKQGSDARDGVAIRADQKSYSYKELISSAWRISSLLCGTELSTEAGKRATPSASVNGVRGHGHLDGARIGIVAKPSAEFVAGMLGTWLSGGVAVPLALSYPEAELLHVMTDSDISMILSTEDYQDLMQSIATKTAAQFSLIPPVASNSQDKGADHLRTREADADKILNNTDIRNENPALIIYTSGTTGKPKGVVHTHRSISAQVQTLAKAWEYASADQFLHCLPLHHILLLSTYMIVKQFHCFGPYKINTISKCSLWHPLLLCKKIL